jgi:hypothetical protein
MASDHANANLHPNLIVHIVYGLQGMGKTSMVNWFARNIRVKVARPSDAVLPPSWARLQAFAGMVHDVIEAAADEPQLIVCDDLVQATLVAQYISIATTSPPKLYRDQFAYRRCNMQCERGQ